MSDKETAPQWAKEMAKIIAAECMAPAPQPAERSDKDYAIEHAEYLAKAVEHYQHKKNSFSKFMETADTDRDEEYIDQLRSELSGAWMGMTAGIYEFRKRAKRAAATPQVTPELELEQEADGRWIAELLGIAAYGKSREEAIRNAAKVLIESEQASPTPKGTK